MEIHAFDLDRGLYHFLIEEIVADLHAHPATELILAHDGGFTICTQNHRFENVRYALVKENQPHAIEACVGKVDVIMCEADVAEGLCEAMGASMVEGILTTDDSAFENYARELLQEPRLKKQYKDHRVLTAVQYCEANLADDLKLNDLAEHVHISASRFSHLFKGELGISFSSYLVWLRLKKAISGYLWQQLNLTEACHHAGFHDSSHFTRHFKKFFGVKPSFPYNNSIVQVSE